ncbi:hypothetical protein QJQ45_004211 [Haematococcus lacustris]|nr:hypothetical protein QJQ45_004211 [Haematococcus lacustris]
MSTIVTMVCWLFSSSHCNPTWLILSRPVAWTFSVVQAEPPRQATPIMISAVSWVPRGAARAVPLVTEVKPQELEALKQRLERQVVLGDDADSDAAGSVSEESAEMDDSDLEAGDAVARARAAAATLKGSRSGKSRSHAGASDAAGSIEAAMQELDMDNYDEPDPEAHGNLVMRAMGGKLAIAPGDDPYLTLGDSEDDSDEVEDLTLKPTDLLILAARNEDDVSNLEVWVYEEAEALGDEANVYVHHELVLPAFPLCLAWLDLSPAGADPSLHGNFVAIGSMEPGIEIWDLDVIDGVEPVAVLGGEDKAATAAAAAAARQEAIEAAEAGGDGKLDKKKKKKLKTKLKKKSTGPVYKPGSHQGPVLGLSWNPEYRNVLASGSADHTVKVRQHEALPTMPHARGSPLVPH